MQLPLQLTPEEEKMMQEVFHVMKKHQGVTRKFGLNLLHSHFPIASNEILFETHDKNSRALFIVPIRLSEVKKGLIATSWILTKKGKIAVAGLCCDSEPPDTRPDD